MKNKKRRAFASYITNNWGLKLLSLIFSIILWSFVVTRTNAERTKTIIDVPVTINGLADLNAQGLTPRDSLSETPMTVKVKLSVSYSDYKFVDKSFISASVDLSSITKDGAAALPVHVSFGSIADAGLISVTPATLNIAIDNIVTRDIPVKLNTSGELGSSLVSVSPEHTQTLTVTGSSYYVDKISQAVADVDLSTLSDGEVLSVLCNYIDEKDNTIKFTGERINVDMDVQTIKELPINVSATGTDSLSAGFKFNSVSAGKVKVCGHKNAIEKLTEIPASPIDVSGKDSSFTSAPIELIIPEGISLVPGEPTPNAKIDISESLTNVTVTRPIIVSGLADGQVATLTVGKTTTRVTSDGASNLEASIVLTGSAVKLSALTDSDVVVKLAINDVGTYELVPVVALSSSIASNVTAQLVSPAQVSVTVKQK